MFYSRIFYRKLHFIALIFTTTGKKLQKYHEIISYLLHKYELHDIHNMISMIR